MTTCATCNRAVYPDDVDADGDCVLCAQESSPEPSGGAATPDATQTPSVPLEPLSVDPGAETPVDTHSTGSQKKLD